MQFQNLPCPQICKLFHTVLFPGVVSIPTPGTFLVPLAAPPPTEWFKLFPSLLWATVNPSVCTIIFMYHAYLTRRTRRLLRGWGIVMLLLSFGTVCGPVGSQGGMACWWNQRNGLSPHTSQSTTAFLIPHHNQTRLRNSISEWPVTHLLSYHLSRLSDGLASFIYNCDTSSWMPTVHWPHIRCWAASSRPDSCPRGACSLAWERSTDMQTSKCGYKL